MIFRFPDLETFHFAVTSGQVPPEVSAAPAEVAFDSDGRPSVRSASGIAPQPLQTALGSLGVAAATEHYSANVVTVDCWPQVLPVSKRPGTPEITATTAVLFEMPAEAMPTVVNEMLRLGNDRQSFRALTAAEGQGERVLLRVVGPPYYTLLRAIDKSTQRGAVVTAYLEKAPHVWVEIGHSHPMAAQIKPAEGQMILLRPEREWSIVADGPFQDVYEIIDFKLPAASVEWHEAHLKARLAVPLRLVPGNAADVPELWVLTESAVDQLDALVRDADERLLTRLTFAVAQTGEQTTIVLKTRPSKMSPPVLSLDKVIGFKPFWKLPNLFLPAGTRLMPTLRRDAVRRLLADNPAQIVWLMPHGDGKFQPEVLHDDVFRPLGDWVDYIIDREHATLSAWMAATRFAFDAFICSEDSADKPKGPPGEKARKKKPVRQDDAAGDADAVPKSPRRKVPAADELAFEIPVEVLAPSAVKVKLRELEKQFLERGGPLDAPERQALWAQLAHYNSLDGRESEAAICWANAFWELPDVPPAGARAWLTSEDRLAKEVTTAAEWEALLSVREESPHEARAFAARVVHACRTSPPSAEFITRLPRIREQLERCEALLGVRTVWLVWWQVARVQGGTDDLALVRVRDRLMRRLLAEGLNKERDLPYFLRTAGEQNSDRMGFVRDRALKVHKLIDQWHRNEDVTVNKPYVDLMFAFGMAKVGEVTAARDLLRTASDKLLEPAGPNGQPDPAHEFLLKAYTWRIENAIQARPHTGPLPAELVARLETIDEGRGHNLGWRYIVDRLRQLSWILEPQIRTVAYRRWLKPASELEKSLLQLADIKDPSRLADAMRTLLRSHANPEHRLLILAHGIPLAPTVGEEFTVGMIEQAPAVIAGLAELAGSNVPKEHLAALAEKQRQLLERSLFLAAHYDRPVLVQVIFNLFLAYLEKCTDDERPTAVNDIARQCLRSLRKLGLRTEIERFLAKALELIVQGTPIAQIRLQPGTRWGDVLSAVLPLAESWLYFGNLGPATAILDEARAAVFQNQRLPKGRAISAINLTRLVRSYISAVGQCPMDDALARIEELLGQLVGLPNSASTARAFSWLHLVIVEDIVRSFLSENMSMSDQARRWLDDDEFLVRRRINDNVRSLSGTT